MPKVTLNIKELKNTLAELSKFNKEKDISSIYSRVLFVSTTSRLTLISVGLESYIKNYQKTLIAITNDEFMFNINFKDIKRKIDKIKSDTTQITFEIIQDENSYDEKVLMSDGFVKVYFSQYDTQAIFEAFQIQTNYTDSIKQSLQMADINRAYNEIGFCCNAPDSSRIEFEGLLFDCSNNEINVIATDSKRLGYINIGKNPTPDDVSFIVDKKALGFVCSLKGSFEIRAIKEGKYKGIYFISEDTKIHLDNIDGHFIDWQKIIPADFKVKARLDSRQLAKGLHLCDSNCIKIQLNQDNSSISELCYDDEASVEFNVRSECNGDNNVIFGLHTKHILDFIHLDKDIKNLNLWLNEVDKPILLQHNQVNCLVMPVLI